MQGFSEEVDATLSKGCVRGLQSDKMDYWGPVRVTENGRYAREETGFDDGIATSPAQKF
jgi:hypothetical protein